MVGELLLWSGVLAMGQFSPGPDFLLVTRAALAGGVREGVACAVGIGCGLVVHATLAVGGTSALFMAGGWLAQTMLWAAAGYLAWLGVLLVRGAWRGGGATAQAAGAWGGGVGRAWRRGFWCNLLNPKVALFLAAAAAPFLAGERPGWWPVLIGAWIAGEGLVLWVAWACVLQAGPVRRGHARAARWVDALFGLALLGLGARLVLEALR